jgi:aminoglycoside phosphotransferase (APT) family kinase protein
LPDGGGVTVPRPLAVIPPLRLGLAEAIPGVPLLPRLVRSAFSADGPSESDRRALTAATTSAARLAAAVHRCPLGAGSLPERNLAGERAAVERELALLEEVWPDVAAHLGRGVSDLLSTLDVGRPVGEGGWPSTPVLAHGDLTPGQVLLDDTGKVGLVDVDTVCVAEPAADLGRFLAYLHVSGVRRSRTAWPLLTELTARFLEAYVDGSGAGAPVGDACDDLWTRVAAYRALTLARVGASTCWQLKDGRLAAVIDVLDAGNDWMGSGSG